MVRSFAFTETKYGGRPFGTGNEIVAAGLATVTGRGLVLGGGTTAVAGGIGSAAFDESGTVSKAPHVLQTVGLPIDCSGAESVARHSLQR